MSIYMDLYLIYIYIWKSYMADTHLCKWYKPNPSAPPGYRRRSASLGVQHLRDEDVSCSFVDFSA